MHYIKNMYLITNILTCFWRNDGDWELVPGPFTMLMNDNIMRPVNF